MRRAVAALATAALLLTGCTATVSAPPPGPTSAPSERPAPPPVDPILEYADDRLATMTLEAKIASMLMVHLASTSGRKIGEFASDHGVGGVILMRDNIPDPESKLRDLTDAARGEDGLPILIATDQEGGIVRRLFSDEGPAAYDLRDEGPSAARDAFADRGELLEKAGISVNFGIVADVTGDETSFIYDRSLGSTAWAAADRVAAAVAGESGHVLSTLKHFPGHGVAPGDSHSSIPSTDMSMQRWQEKHEPPFAAGISAGAELVMLGHLRFDEVDPVPATLSPVWHRVLRDDLGFDGITITDDMNMLERSGEGEYRKQTRNAVAAVAAGNTMLLYVGAIDIDRVVDAVADAVREGTIPEAVVDDAAHRLLVLRRTLSGETGPYQHCFEQCQQVIE